MDLAMCPVRRRPNPMCPKFKYKPIFASQFQPKEGMKLNETPLQQPIFYNWSHDYVGKWLASIGFGIYSDMFIRNRITGERLYHMTQEDFHRLGVYTLSEADEIVSKVQCLDQCVEHEKASRPMGIPVHHHKCIYFGEKPLYMKSKPLDGCSL